MNTMDKKAFVLVCDKRWGAKKMKAVIMAGGEGSRLRPLTCDLPKPMVPIMNVPIMEHIIHLLKDYGIKDIAVTLMYMPQKIKDYFGNGSNFGVNLHYFIEDTPLGTAGSVKNAEAFLDQPFIVISGDCLTNINLQKALAFHHEKKAMATLILTKVDVPLEYGVVITDENRKITGFLEKPSWGEVFSDTVNTGTYILEPEIFMYIKKGERIDFSQNLFPKLLEEKHPVYGYVTKDYWCDIGDLQAYIKAHYDVFDGKLQLKHDATEIKKGVWVGSGTVIGSKARLDAPCFIGNHCRIANGCIIDSMTVIGSNNVIEEKVSIKRSIIWNNNYFEQGSEIRGAIIGNKVNVKANVSIFENASIGDGCVINERAIIKPNVKIWPSKSVDPLAVVDRNLVWASRHARAVFGENGVSGIINVDINCEFATRLGAAYGSTLKKGSKVVVSSTTANSVRMFKHAFISGILSVGVEVFNLSSLLTPISRHAINFLAVEGGIHIKLCNYNPNRLRVDFMDSKGAGISRVMERRIESAFFREDFRRCSGEEISRLNNITDFKNYYVRSILNELENEAIRDRGLKVCVFSPSDFVTSIVVPMLTDIGCKVSSFSGPDLGEEESLIEKVKSNEADFGAFIDLNGESLVLIDQHGSIIKDDLFTALTTLILFKSIPGAKVVVPFTAPSVIDKMALSFHGNVHRTKTSPQAVMEQMLSHNQLKSKENMIQFMLNFDALASMVKILEYMSVHRVSLTSLLSEIPPFFICKKNIFCPWELKGKVMRKLITRDDSIEKAELLDGVKFKFQNGWVLVLPDADLPMLRVFSEGENELESENHVNMYAEKIRKIIHEGS
jgi:mannose-1-phosphate guanylyltransferase / phosphomannomutase